MLLTNEEVTTAAAASYIAYTLHRYTVHVWIPALERAMRQHHRLCPIPKFRSLKMQAIMCHATHKTLTAITTK
jgi:hypothetical protein